MKHIITRYPLEKLTLLLAVVVLGISISTISGAKVMDGDSAAKSGGEIALVSPRGHQAIKASVIDKTPSAYTIDVKKFANMNVNEEAPTFAVYTKGSMPSKCGDFRKLELNYEKPSKYERVFNLSEHKEVLTAIDNYGCVVMRNIPPKG